MYPITKIYDPRELPRSFDARDKREWSGLISPVQNQGWCGASWAFSTATTAADRVAIQSPERKLVDLSEQNIIDCGYVREDGCQGGNLDRAWNYLRRYGWVWTWRSDVGKRRRTGRVHRVGDFLRRSASWGVIANSPMRRDCVKCWVPQINQMYPITKQGRGSWVSTQMLKRKDQRSGGVKAQIEGGQIGQDARVSWRRLQC